MDNREIILNAEKSNTPFRSNKKTAKITKDVPFQLKRGKILAIVGESGCGKSVTMNSIIRFTGENAIVEAENIQYSALKDGEVKEYHLESVKEPNGLETHSLRRSDISVVSQSPMSSLNPVYKVGDQVVKGLLQHNKGMTRQQTHRKVSGMLKKLGIPDLEERIDCSPHQFSGGVEQRVVIATAMIYNPELIIRDEPTMALDVTIQAQIMELLKKFQVKDGKFIILTTHNTGLVTEIADEVYAIYTGRVVEFRSPEDVFDRTSRPYTKALPHNVPVPGLADGQKLEAIPGATSSPSDLKEGCEFTDRCPKYTENCRKGVAPVYEAGPGHHVRYLKYRSCPETEWMDENREVVPKVENLQTWFLITKEMLKEVVGHVKAVDDVSLEVYKGETLGTVGESGCEKSTLGKTVMMLEWPAGGRMLFNFGDEFKDTTQFNKEGMLNFREKVQMVFRDPYSTLNPQRKIYSSFEEPLKAHGTNTLEGRKEMMQKVLKMVNIQLDYLMQYPHELFGGQRQRFCITRTLEVMPEILICDEPVLALNVSIQAQVPNMTKEMQEEMKLTYLFIAHGLSVAQRILGRIVVMHPGRIMEAAGSGTLYDEPLHPYTQALLSVIPVVDIYKTKKCQILEGEVPSPIHRPDGCPFHSRCPKCMEICKTQPPVMMHHGAEGYMVAYHLYNKEGKQS